MQIQYLNKTPRIGCLIVGIEYPGTIVLVLDICLCVVLLSIPWLVSSYSVLYSYLGMVKWKLFFKKQPGLVRSFVLRDTLLHI